MREHQAPIPVRVTLDDMTEADFLRVRNWSIEMQPETQTCRPISLRTDAEVVQQFRDRRQDDAGHDFAIHRVSDGRLLGRIRYFNLNSRNRSAEIGYLLAAEVQGQGYATEALGLLLRHLIEETGLNKVYAQTAEFNLASIALLKRWGFRLDGRLRQHHELGGVLHDDLIFSLLAEEYRLIPKPVFNQ